MSPSRIHIACALVVVAVVAIGSRETMAAPSVDELVQVKLLADSTGVKAGQPFTVGVLMTIAPKWHVYWANPGDTGLPTAVKFKAPEGFTVGELQFPTPVRFNQPGDVIGYGYTGSVMLTAKVTPPAGVKVGDKVQFEAAVSWLVCHDTCLPGKAKVDLTLPVSDAPAPAEAATFKSWTDRLPVDPGASTDVAKLEWAAGAKPDEASLTITWKPDAKDVRSVSVFPGPDDSLDARSISMSQDGDRTTIIVQVKPLAGQKSRTEPLPSVLGYTTKAGERRGVSTAIPMKK